MCCWNPLSRATPWWLSGMLCSAWNMLLVDLDVPLGTVGLLLRQNVHKSVASWVSSILMLFVSPYDDDGGGDDDDGMMRTMTDEHEDDDVKDDVWWWQRRLWPFGKLCVCAYYLICGMVSWGIVRTLLYLENDGFLSSKCKVNPRNYAHACWRAAVAAVTSYLITYNIFIYMLKTF